jgi:hypothetical protein
MACAIGDRADGLFVCGPKECDCANHETNVQAIGAGLAFSGPAVCTAAGNGVRGATPGRAAAGRPRHVPRSVVFCLLNS